MRDGVGHGLGLLGPVGPMPTALAGGLEHNLVVVPRQPGLRCVVLGHPGSLYERSVGSIGHGHTTARGEDSPGCQRHSGAMLPGWQRGALRPTSGRRHDVDLERKIRSDEAFGSALHDDVGR